MICGIDEAGKGSVLGPMVIGGVAGLTLSDFKNHGYADSKTLSPKRREELYDEIVSNFDYAVVVLSAVKIDECRLTHSMNDVVAISHARTLDKLDDIIHAKNLAKTTAYLDACDVNELRYATDVAKYLKNSQNFEIVSEHKADFKYPVVSAASIVAKVTRDRLIEDLYAEYGNFGSGYPSDPITIKFLEGYIREKSAPPVIARKSWKTVSNITAKLSQRSLFDY